MNEQSITVRGKDRYKSGVMEYKKMGYPHHPGEADGDRRGGRTIPAMTFNGSMPGPLLVVHQGDYVEVTLVNPATNSMRTTSTSRRHRRPRRRAAHAGQSRRAGRLASRRHAPACSSITARPAAR